MSTRSCRGVTLIELVAFIVIVGVGMAGLFAAFNTMTAASADPQVRKQVLAIAESLMDEVALMPFTFCDPDDANAATATSATVGVSDPAKCATAAEVAAVNTTDPATNESGETRYGATTQFDNVNDYHGFSMSGIRNIADAAITGLGSYTASVTVTQAGLGGIAAAEALLISVTVTGPSGFSTTLEGYRTRYAPNTLP
ncbi:MAG: type II secretion system protein [Betaproteobacteria bacterium]|nr:type II secretion system protein [Betaproteobacteria bacterium]